MWSWIKKRLKGISDIFGFVKLLWRIRKMYNTLKEKGMRKFWATMIAAVATAILGVVFTYLGIPQEQQKMWIDTIIALLITFVGGNVAEHALTTVRSLKKDSNPLAIPPAEPTK